MSKASTKTSDSSSLINRIIYKFLPDPKMCTTIPFSEKGIVLAAFMHRFSMRALMAALALIATVLGLYVPVCQHHFVDLLTIAEQNSAIIWLGLAFLAALSQQLLTFGFRIIGNSEGLIIQQSLAQLVYAKSINLSPSARASKTVGEIVNYYAQDIPIVSTFIEEFLPSALISIISLIAAPIAISLTLKIPMTAVLTITATSIFISIWLGRRQARFFILNKQNAQTRLSVVNEWLQNMRAIRFLGWTDRFEKRILQTRQTETTDRLAMVTNGSIMNSIAQVTPFFLNVAGVLALLQSRASTVTAGEVFAVLWIFGVFFMRPLRIMPFLIATWYDAQTSARRLEAFLKLSQENDSSTTNHTLSSFDNTKESIEVQALTLLIDSKTVLNNISMQIPAGAFIAIVGEVGAGKTTLLHSLLRILPASFATYKLNSSSALTMSLSELRSHFGYVSQDGFVMSASLRDNVSFSYDTQEHQDESIIASLAMSQFSMEVESMPEGLRTEIGERGVNLSGGQKQRVNLARCAFFDRPILLLDDCLSALDVTTERKVIANLFKGLWAKKTRILVTHRISVLKEVDWIYFMEAGSVVEQGTFEELSQSSARLKKFIELHMSGAGTTQ